MFRRGLNVVLLLLFVSAVGAGTNAATPAQDRVDLEILQNLEQQLELKWADLSDYSDQERLSLALSQLAQIPEFQRGVQISTEVLHWYKTKKNPISAEDREILSTFARTQFQIHIERYLNERRITHPHRTVLFPIIKEVLKGSLASGLALFSIWATSTGQHVTNEDWQMGLRAFGLIAAMYTLYRPFKVVKILTDQGEIDQLRITQQELDSKLGPVPQPIWQAWLILKELTSASGQNLHCTDLLTASGHLNP